MRGAPINYPEFNYVEKAAGLSAPAFVQRNYAASSARARAPSFCARVLARARISRAISRIGCAAQSALYVTPRYGRLEFQALVESRLRLLEFNKACRSARRGSRSYPRARISIFLQKKEAETEPAEARERGGVEIADSGYICAVDISYATRLIYTRYECICAAANYIFV